MSFHCSDCSEYVRSGHKLIDNTLDLLAKYFEAIFNAKLGNGLLQKKREEQIKQSAQNKLQHELKERYRKKVRAYANSRMHGQSTSRSWHCKRDGRSNRRGKRGTYKPLKEATHGGDHKCWRTYKKHERKEGAKQECLVDR